jgi:hypothetical protein
MAPEVPRRIERGGALACEHAIRLREIKPKPRKTAMFPICHLVKKTAREVIIAAALAGICAPVYAHVGPPVKVSLASADTVRRGEPSTIYVVLLAAADVDHAEYALAPPAGWQVIDGPTQWTGSMKAGQRLEFQIKAVPLSDEPGDLQASLRLPNQLEYKAALHPDRMGGQFPEKGTVDEVSTGKNIERASAVIEPQFEPGAALPEPADAAEPQLPGQPANLDAVREAPEPQSAKGTRAAAVSINATGRFTYLDNNGVRRGLRNATVELWNENPMPSLGDERCAKGITDSNGNFSLGANCGDLFDGPDLFVRLVLNNSIVEVKPDNIFAGSYTARSATRQNSAGGNVNFGTLTVTSNRGAMQTHNLVMRAHQFMATVNESMSKVTVHWPGQGTFYQGAFAAITLESDMPFGEEGAVFHEYGHHVLTTKAESPSPDYDNGVCDEPGNPGHCLFSPENGRVSWTEGWPNFFAAVLHERHNTEDGYGPTMMSFETLPTLNLTASQLDNVEGVIAGILFDLVDAENDDQGVQGPGRRDNLNLTFADTWNVVRNFDPSGDLFHNHPTSIHEFWEGLRELESGSINRISEVYREHGIVKPQPDVRVSSLEEPPSQLPRNTTFTLSSTVQNDGNEGANNAFSTRFQLIHTITGAAVSIGTRTTSANLAAGASDEEAVNVTVPAATPAGTYRLRACADSGGAVPESDENDNCRTSATVTTVR